MLASLSEFLSSPLINLGPILVFLVNWIFMAIVTPGTELSYLTSFGSGNYKVPLSYMLRDIVVSIKPSS